MENYKKLLPAFIILGSLFVAFGVVYAQASQNASIILQRQTQGLFELTIRDPDGIQSFSIQPEKKSSYGGEVKCPKTYSSKNVVFSFEDFTPPMKAFVVDCAGNQTDFEISEPDSKGVARAKVIIPAAAPESAPSSSQAPAVPQETSSAPAPAKEKSFVDVSYPVKELGNCGNQESCISYCDDEAHINECLVFAKKYNLLSEDEVRKADKFTELGGKGPGGCSSRKSCETYCGDISRMDECLDWGEKNGFISDKELIEAKKIQTAVKGGAKLPGGCKSKQGCEEYCTNPDNIDECIQFAESSGILPPEELAEAKKVSEFIKRGETPGGCRSKDQCERYCSAENNLEECIAFAEKTGLASKEELELFKKTGGKGPGGCKGKAQCEAFCNSSEHQEECFSWAREHDLLKEEDLERMREGASHFKDEFEKMPPEVAECLKSTVGEEVLNKMLAGEPVFAKDMGEKMQKCFAEAFESFGGEFGAPGEGGEGEFEGPEGRGRPEGSRGGQYGSGFPEGFSGPGGCSSPEECFKFCFEHREECEGFGAPAGDAERHEGRDFPSEEGRSPREVETPDFTGQTHSADFNLKCDEGWQPELDVAGRKYCAIKDCNIDSNSKGKNLVIKKDRYGRNVCVPSDDFAPNREADYRKSEGQAPQFDAQQYEEKYREQYQKPLEKQFQEFLQGQIPGADDQIRRVEPPAGTGSLTVCPKMPTVDTCPSGQRKEIAFSSPECGTYYTCIPEPASETFSAPSSGTMADPAKVCAENKGTWDGQTCVYPMSPGSSNIQPGAANSLDTFLGTFGF